MGKREGENKIGDMRTHTHTPRESLSVSDVVNDGFLNKPQFV